jgi:heptosyltransferase-2
MYLDLPQAFLYIPRSELHTGQMLMNDKRHRILLIRFSSLGDLVLLTALVEGIADTFPAHDLHVATKEQYRELFDGNRHVEKLHTLPAGAGFRDLLRLWRRLRAERFDTIIDAHNVIRSNFLYRTLDARIKIQLGKDQLRKLTLIRGGKDLYGDTISMKDRYLGLLSALETDVPDLPTRLDPPPEAEAEAGALFEASSLSGRTVVALAPGARWDTKRWPARSFSEVASALSARGYGVLVIGDRSEREICRMVASGDGCADACGKLSLMGTASALRRASVLVTNDSAPLHIAEAVGTPVVALFGPTVRQFGYFPLLKDSIVLERDIECRPCSRNGARPCRIANRDCLEKIDSSEVLSAVDQVIRSRGEEK